MATDHRAMATDDRAGALDSQDYGYAPAVLPEWIERARRTRAKDAFFVEVLASQLRPGSVLEVGAGCGQIAELLSTSGWDATASDIQPFFVDHIRTRGVPARVLDVLDLGDSGETWDNVIGTGVSPMINRDETLIEASYRSVRSILGVGSRFVFVLPSPWWPRRRWSSPPTHIRLARRSGFRLVRRFRNQPLPSVAYRRLPRRIVRFVESTAGRLVGVRWVLVFEAVATDP
jgi:SAM-dependent methyltransferase